MLVGLSTAPAASAGPALTLRNGSTERPAARDPALGGLHIDVLSRDPAHHAEKVGMAANRGLSSFTFPRPVPYFAPPAHRSGCRRRAGDRSCASLLPEASSSPWLPHLWPCSWFPAMDQCWSRAPVRACRGSCRALARHAVTSFNVHPLPGGPVVSAAPSSRSGWCGGRRTPGSRARSDPSWCRRPCHCEWWRHSRCWNAERLSRWALRLPRSALWWCRTSFGARRESRARVLRGGERGSLC